jgi:hypothetical protein
VFRYGEFTVLGERMCCDMVNLQYLATRCLVIWFVYRFLETGCCNMLRLQVLGDMVCCDMVNLQYLAKGYVVIW